MSTISQEINMLTENSRDGVNLMVKNSLSITDHEDSGHDQVREEAPAGQRKRGAETLSNDIEHRTAQDYCEYDEPKDWKLRKMTSAAVDNEMELPKQDIEELTEERILKRQKQINIGKNTLGYNNYIKFVPKEKRVKDRLEHPSTPDCAVHCSKRSWDGQVRKWRRALHLWDHPSEVDPVPPICRSESGRQRKPHSPHRSNTKASTVFGGSASSELAKPKQSNDQLQGRSPFNSPLLRKTKSHTASSRRQGRIRGHLTSKAANKTEASIAISDDKQFPPLSLPRDGSKPHAEKEDGNINSGVWEGRLSAAVRALPCSPSSSGQLPSAALSARSKSHSSATPISLARRTSGNRCTGAAAASRHEEGEQGRGKLGQGKRVPCDPPFSTSVDSVSC